MIIDKKCPAKAFYRCIGDDCQWWHQAFNRCSVLSMAIGLTYEPAKAAEEDEGSIDLPQEIVDKLKKAGVQSYADIGRMGGIASLLGQGIITVGEANTMADALERWREFTEASKPTTPGVRKCRGCGCTDDLACPGGCYWVEEDLCSACAKESSKPGDLGKS
jgi:hypothetical protein